ncbi:BrnA antitoxin family protein [Aphanothece sacrum]|uniref:BrnA antitoxin family protein n=1 Tax=Aphanothece sacrum FPU1 TaxID=1920663 RepID=A0A401II93_APHSA|nr:BrnA antitoxin family protein [Aphanothece sacrum]GBF80890.1 hypothetical protein AsFPU1_2298 [Aphanothece sacrum FPU1]GBF85197.1 hypothetical protein AsFPU3_2255 [Aphanothece sacrum FPU3]
MNKDHDSLKEDEENPIWTKDDFEKAQPAQNVLPKEFFASMKKARGQRGKQKDPTKQQVTLRLDPEIIDYFKSQKPEGWQTRLNQALKSYIDEHPI